MLWEHLGPDRYRISRLVLDNKNDAQEALNLAKEQAGVIGACSIEKMMGECHVPSAK